MRLYESFERALKENRRSFCGRFNNGLGKFGKAFAFRIDHGADGAFHQISGGWRVQRRPVFWHQGARIHPLDSHSQLKRIVKKRLKNNNF